MDRLAVLAASRHADRDGTAKSLLIASRFWLQVASG
jgi:hypothetical protein